MTHELNQPAPTMSRKIGIASGVRPGKHGPHWCPDGAYAEAASNEMYARLGGFCIYRSAQSGAYYPAPLQGRDSLRSACPSDELVAAYEYHRLTGRFVGVPHA